MLTLNDSIDGLKKWISYEGRINRKTFWLCYVLPAVIFFALRLYLPYVGLISFALLLIGTVKRFHDFNVGKGFLGSVGGVWVAVMIVAVLAAVVLFFGGISGAGNKGMLEKAGMIVVIPMLAILLLPLFAGIKAGSPGENKYGPPPAPLTRASVMPLVAVLGVLVIGLGGMQIAREVAQREPALIVAVAGRDLEAVRELLESGADPNQVSRSGESALAEALSYTVYPEMAAMLLAHGADPNVAHDYTGDMVLQEAVRIKNFEVVQMLLEHGADPNHPNNQSVLWLAVRLGEVNIAKALLAKGANPQHREDGRTPREWLEAYKDDSGVRITYDEMIALLE
jgi:uncharacterized membrane protein YhaH (DUF805 family)